MHTNTYIIKQQVAQGPCGDLILGGIQKLYGHIPGQPDPDGPARAGGVGPDDLQSSTILWFCETYSEGNIIRRFS